MGELGFCGCRSPRSTGAPGADAVTWAPRARGARTGRRSRRDHGVGRGRPRRRHARPLRDPRAEAAVARRRSPPARCSAWFGSDRAGRAGPTRPRSERRARFDDGEWVIDGSKSFITNSGTADHRRSSSWPRPPRRARTHGVSTILVPADTPGFTVGPVLPQARLALQRHPRALVRRLPRAEGEPARATWQGVRPMPRGAGRRTDLDRGAVRRPRAGVPRRERRLRHGARGVRPADRCATRRSRSRSPTCARRSTPRDCSPTALRGCKDQGRPYTTEAALAKLRASETAVDVAREAIQIHGGYGYTRSSRSRASTATRRCWRSARAPARSSDS